MGSRPPGTGKVAGKADGGVRVRTPDRRAQRFKAHEGDIPPGMPNPSPS